MVHRASPRPGPRRAAERLTATLIAGFLLLALLAPTPATAGWWDDAAEAREATLRELRSKPARWRDVPVLLRARFGGTGERANPFFTQFTPERWQPVTLLPLTTAPEPDDGLATAFVLRGSRDDLRLARISPNREVLVRAVVRDAVAGEPWVEILSFTLDGDPLTPEESTLILEADRFLESRNPEAAEKRYRRVLDERRLADRDRAALLRKIGVAQHDQGRPREALLAFREALALDPEDLDAKHRATHLEESLARVPLAPSPDGLPPTSGSASRTTPETPQPRDTPLLLPGGERGLAPPRGLPLGDEPQPRTTQPRTTTPRTTPPKPASALPPPRSGKPTPPSPPPAESEEAAVDEPAPEAPEEDLPPPMPKPPKLSGPK
jgi:tetratricopeptide (TPR) repeat protein